MSWYKKSQVADPAQNVQQMNADIMVNNAEAQAQFMTMQEQIQGKKQEWDNEVNDLFQASRQAVIANDWQTAINYMTQMVHYTTRTSAEMTDAIDMMNHLSQQMGVAQDIAGGL